MLPSATRSGRRVSLPVRVQQTFESRLLPPLAELSELSPDQPVMPRCYRSIILCDAPGIRTFSVPSSSSARSGRRGATYGRRWPRSPACPLPPRLPSAAWRIRRIDDHMAGRTGHLALAGALERLVCLLGDIEQACARRRLDLAAERAIGRQETNQRHATALSCRSAASWIWVRADTSSSSLV